MLSAAGPAHTAGLRVVALAAATLSVVPCFSFLGIHICPLVQSRSFHFDACDSLIPPLSMLSCLGVTGPLASNPLALASVTGNGEDIDFESSSGYLVGSLSSWAPGPLTVLSVAAAVALSSATPPIFLLLCCLAWLGFSNQQSFLVSRWNYSPLRWLLLSCLGCGFLPSPCAAIGCFSPLCQISPPARLQLCRFHVAIWLCTKIRSHNPLLNFRPTGLLLSLAVACSLVVCRLFPSLASPGAPWLCHSCCLCGKCAWLPPWVAGPLVA